MGTSVAELETAEKQGFDTGIRAVHPFDKSWTLPVYVANFILMDYGTGAIFGCPSGDQRDLDFARKYGLPFEPVILPPGEDAETFAITDKAFDGDGTMINSRFLDGMTTHDAFEETAKRLEKAKLNKKPVGTRKVNYRLRDWGISRQRFWGCPIPVIHCEACGVVPVPDNDLPGRAARGRHLRQARQSARPPSDLEARQVPRVRRRGRARDRHHGHLRRQLVVLRALHRAPRQDAGRQAGGRLLASRRPVHRRHRARDPAPALLALLHARHVRHRPPEADAERARAVRRAVHARDGDARDLQVQARRLAACRARCASKARATSAPRLRDRERRARRDRRRREDVEVAQEHRRSRRVRLRATAPTSRAGSCSPTARPSAT